ncbi:MAG: uroporphyrinogen decarboxylase, partial [bacterium]|nr:uroporphyrinogen decarboxylase [bacterium]
MSRADRFLNACRKKPVDATPVWLMRQAGRYMAEYRALKEKYEFLEMVKTPDLAAEVTMQPVNAFDVDAAIIFQDLLPILEPMGLQLEYLRGEGPVIHNPIRTPGDIDALVIQPAEEATPYTFDAIRQLRRELDGRVPLIGFAGAPFTLVSYAVEGGGSRNYTYAKGLMYGQQ